MPRVQVINATWDVWMIIRMILPGAHALTIAQVCCVDKNNLYN